jgi:hypothetical protein
MTALTDWENFYIIVGGSAGALIGLQFVVITLIADMPKLEGAEQATGVFTTPSVIHFSVVLLLAAIISIPWTAITPVAVLWGLIGLAGMGYLIIVIRRMRTQIAYEPVFEDKLFHVLLPMAAYVTMALAAAVASHYEHCALFGVGAASLVLLFTGIHNAWDLVTHIVFIRRQEQSEEAQKKEKEKN